MSRGHRSWCPSIFNKPDNSMDKKNLFIVFLIFSGCATINQLPVAVKSVDIPYYRQTAYQCGPISLASVINYWNRRSNLPEISVDEVLSSLYSPGARGVLGIDLELYARSRGFATFQKSGSVEDLLKLIDRGIPPIILVSYGFSILELDHFMVVKGYNEKGIITNGKKPDEFIPYKELERIWGKTGYWMLVITPSGISPFTD